jgi:hypothetical protein
MEPNAPTVPLMQCPIAGFQFHGGGDCWARMQPGDALELRREPGNRHDARAISVEWNRVMLGYVPKEANYALSQVLDRGGRVAARIAKLRDTSDPWHRVMMEIAVVTEPVTPSGRAPAAKEILLLPARPRGAFRLTREPLLTPFVPRQLDTAEAALRECASEVNHRLGLPLRGIQGPATREVLLWEVVVIRIGADGRGLSAASLTEPSFPFPQHALTLDLRRPITWETWTVSFARLVSRICDRHGIPKDEGRAQRRWIRRSLELTFGPGSNFDDVRQAALAFLAPDPLARSLSNRVFGPGAAAESFNWLGRRTAAVALCAVDHPGMLPFLRLARHEITMKFYPDPLASLHAGLMREGLEPAAWKALPRWGFPAFAALGESRSSPAVIAGFANLLHRIEPKAAVTAKFAAIALHAVFHRNPAEGDIDFHRHPAWFMRALLRETERAEAARTLEALEEDLDLCLDWLVEARPDPDPNQQHAGWPWIVGQARAHRHARELERLAPWPVPCRVITFNPSCRAVVIGSVAELVAEGIAMKNCLAGFEDECRAGELVVFSIRSLPTDERIACLSVTLGPAGWQLVELAGKMNKKVPAEIAAVADKVVAALDLVRRPSRHRLG